MSSYVVGFSWDKLQAAKDFLCAVKPRWGRYLSRFTFVPFSVDPPPGREWGGVIFSTPTWHIYVDSGYIASAPLEHIAGLIEKELHHAARDMRGRLYHARRGDFARYARIAAELEVCDVMRRESEGKNLVDAFTRPLSSMVFSRDELLRWGVEGIPRVPEDFAWYPEDFGYPSGLTMEEYFALLKSGETGNQEDEAGGQEGTPPEDEEEGSGGEDCEGDSAPDDADGGADSGSEEDGETSDSDDQGAQEDEGSSEDDQDSSSAGAADSPEGEQEDEGADGDGGDEGTSAGDGVEPSSTPESGHDADTPDVPGDVGGSAGEAGSTPDSPNDGVVEGTGESGAEPVEGAPSGRGTSGSTPATAGGVAPGEGENSSSDEALTVSSDEALTVQETIDELSKEPGRDWFTKEYEPMDPPAVDSIGSTVQDSDALKELAEDIEKDMADGCGLTPGEEVVGFSTTILERGKVKWEKALANILARTIGDTKIHGLQDYSYNVRNRNQQETGPVLMGMYDTDPSIFVVIDTSGSMENFIGESLGAFSDVLLRTAATSGAEVGWASVSVGVVDAGVDLALSEDMARDFVLGLGGTDIGETIKQVSSGKFVWKGRRFERPDILIVITDCQWTWPYPNNRTFPSDTHIIVASVVDWDEAWGYFKRPRWLTKRRWVKVGE